MAALVWQVRLHRHYLRATFALTSITASSTVLVITASKQPFKSLRSVQCAKSLGRCDIGSFGLRGRVILLIGPPMSISVLLRPGTDARKSGGASMRICPPEKVADRCFETSWLSMMRRMSCACVFHSSPTLGYVFAKPTISAFGAPKMASGRTRLSPDVFVIEAKDEGSTPKPRAFKAKSQHSKALSMQNRHDDSSYS